MGPEGESREGPKGATVLQAAGRPGSLLPLPIRGWHPGGILKEPRETGRSRESRKPGLKSLLSPLLWSRLSSRLSRTFSLWGRASSVRKSAHSWAGWGGPVGGLPRANSATKDSSSGGQGQGTCSPGALRAPRKPSPPSTARGPGGPGNGQLSLSWRQWTCNSSSSQQSWARGNMPRWLTRRPGTQGTHSQQGTGCHRVGPRRDCWTPRKGLEGSQTQGSCPNTLGGQKDQNQAPTLCPL